VTSTEPQEVLLPCPQLTGCQVPLSYFITTTPAGAATEVRLRTREGGNVVVAVRLTGKKQEVRVGWAAVVLLGPHEVTPDRTPADPYRKATASAQAGAEEITALAAAAWPKTGKAADFAANIQGHVRDMKRAERPRSLDALGILRSGESGICTANANLAAALMRTKGVACRSVAVIPTIGQRLEMHRIVAFADDGRWVPFDPSSLTADIPAKPCQNIIMARSTPADEEAGMKPRMGAMPGCPYGQEAEPVTTGVNLFGPDFFWTLAKPLAEFEPAEDAVRRAAKEWTHYLEAGTLSSGQLRAASVKTAAELVELLNKK
jgi:Transglutaminase-like superfamily